MNLEGLPYNVSLERIERQIKETLQKLDLNSEYVITWNGVFNIFEVVRYSLATAFNSQYPNQVAFINPYVFL